MMTVLGRGCVAALVAAGLCVSGSAAFAEDASTELSPSVQESPYPGAEEILDEHGVRFLGGDGGIVFAGVKFYGEGFCAPGEIQVEQVWDSRVRFICFRTVSDHGFLSMEVDRVFAVWSGESPVHVTVADTSGVRKFVEIEADSIRWVAVETADELPRTTLLEIRLHSELEATVTSDCAQVCTS